MDLINKLQDLKNEILTNEEIEKFIKDIDERLENMENEIKTYTVDRIEGNIVVCENRATKEMININIKDLPEDISEGEIIENINGKFYKNENEKSEIENRIRKKMDDLWN